MDSYPYKQHFLFAGAVGLCASILYSSSFWGSFSFNALEYISIADLTSHTLLPLLVAFAGPLLGFGLSNLVLGESMPPSGGADSSIGKFCKKHWRLFIIIQMIFFLIVLRFGSMEIKSAFLPLILAMFSVPLSQLEITIEFMPNPRARSIALFLAILLPTFAISAGSYEAFKCKIGQGKYQVDLARTKIDFQGDTTNPVVYLGYLSGTYVFFEKKTSGIVLVKQKDDIPVFLKPNPGRT
jgi:hypothetical protein